MNSTATKLIDTVEQLEQAVDDLPAGGKIEHVDLGGCDATIDTKTARTFVRRAKQNQGDSPAGRLVGQSMEL